MVRQRQLVLLLGLSLFTVSFTACTGAESRKASFIQKGEALMSEHNYAKARLEFLIALQIDPNDTNAQTLAAAAAEQAGDYHEAAGLYRAALTDSSNLRARAGLAKLYIFGGAPEKARKLVDKGLAKGPAEPTLLAIRAATKALHADTAGAKADAEAALKVAPNNEDAAAIRASLYAQANEWGEAIALIERISRLNPKSIELPVILAQLYVSADRKADAERQLRSAVQANPRDIATRLALAKLLINAGRPEEAQPVVDQLVADQPADVPSLEAAFRVQAARHDLVGARRTAAAIQTLRPEAATGYYLTGLVDEAEDKLNAARIVLEHVMNIAPDSIEPLAALVRIDMAQKHPTRALARIDEVIKRSPRNPVIRQLKAQTLNLLKRWDEVITVSAVTTKLAPKWWAPYRTRAVAELSSGKTENALQTYRKGIAATGGAPMLVTDLAALHERQGKPELAIADYEGWLKREPGSDVGANNLAMLLITHHGTDSAARARALQLSERFQVSNNAAFLDTYAWVRYTRGEYNEAVPPLQHAVDLAPHVPALRARLGLAQKGAGQREAAQKNLESALIASSRFVGVEDARAALAELKRGS